MQDTSAFCNKKFGRWREVEEGGKPCSMYVVVEGEHYSTFIPKWLGTCYMSRKFKQFEFVALNYMLLLNYLHFLQPDYYY